MNRETILGLLDNTKHALSTQDIIPIYTHFAFDGNTVTAYDDVVAIEFPFKFEHSCCLPGLPLHQYLSALKGKKVDFFENGDSIVVKSGRSKVSFPYIPIGNFIFKFPRNSKKDSVIKVDSDFIRGLEMCSISVSSDPTYLYTTGITLCDDSADGLMLFSTDLRTLSNYNLYAESSGKPIKGTRYMIMPHKFCKVLIKLSQVHEITELRINDSVAVAYFGDSCRVFTKLIDSVEAPDFKGVFNDRQPYPAGKVVGFDIGDELLSMIDRADVVFGDNVLEKILNVRIIKNEGIMFSAKSTYGSFKEKLLMDGIDADVEHCMLSLDLLKRGIEKKVICERMMLLDSNAMLQYGESGEFTYLVNYLEVEED